MRPGHFDRPCNAWSLRGALLLSASAFDPQFDSRSGAMGEFDDNPEFQKLLAGRDDVDLVQFMLELAADAYPQLDRMGCLLEIDRLGVACCDHQSQRRASCTRSRLVATSQLLYEIEGFHGNCEGYYEVQNSYLNDVLRGAVEFPFRSASFTWPLPRAPD